MTVNTIRAVLHLVIFLPWSNIVGYFSQETGNQVSSRVKKKKTITLCSCVIKATIL